MSDLNAVIRQICLHFPESEEAPSRNSPTFKVRGKPFAMYIVNHHGDGRISLWLNFPADIQSHYVENDPDNFFVPPYMGVRGWLGVHLNHTLSWNRIALIVEEAYCHTAPRKLTDQITPMPDIKPPDHMPTVAELDPLNTENNRAVIDQVRQICLELPESLETRQFGSPSFKGGKKTFCVVEHQRGRLWLQAWVGAERQSMLTFDERYQIPPYIGHRGWINLDVTNHQNWTEIDNLVIDSYRHFALKRMLTALAKDVTASL